MLVDDRAVQRQTLPIQHGTGIAHRHGKRHALRHAHVMEINGHRQRGDLPFRHHVVANAVDEKADFRFA